MGQICFASNYNPDKPLPVYDFLKKIPLFREEVYANIFLKGWSFGMERKPIPKRS